MSKDLPFSEHSLLTYTVSQAGIFLFFFSFLFFFFFLFMYDLACLRRHQNARAVERIIGIYSGLCRIFEPEGLQSWMSGGLSACGFVQQACQALLFQPLNLCQTVNVLMLIQVSGSAGRCQGEWEAVNKEITYIHRVIAAVCQVEVWKEGSREKKKEGGSKQLRGRVLYICI